MAKIHSMVLRTVKDSLVRSSVDAQSAETIRIHALAALQKSLATAKRAVIESASKDILKQMRNCVTDKSLPVQREAAYSLENADHATRHSLAQLVGHMLASAQIECSVSVPDSPQKVKKDEDDTDAGLSSVVSTAAEIGKSTLTPTEMLNHLSNQFNKRNVSQLHLAPSATAPGILAKHATQTDLQGRKYREIGSLAESTQVTLLQSAVSLFASPDGYAGSSVQAAIASSSVTSTSVWQTVDGYAYGVSSNGILDVRSGVVGDDPNQGRQDYFNRDAVEVSIDGLAS
ncbi:hypothetical protein C0993_007345 [Termitomyces sp. T159_Od127]|nr:hypothetical protein C0993_007345 [Termitomyces sp. T159_Od127]